MAPVIPRDGPRGHTRLRRRFDPREAFEVLVDHRYETDSWRLRWRSRLFGLDRSLEIRREWAYHIGRNGDPRILADFVEELVGRDLMNWAELGVDGRAMAEAMTPLWDREIFRYMERLERQGRDYLASHDFNREYLADFAPFVTTREDPEAAKKARATLLRQLDKEQKASFEKDKKFVVTGKDGKAYTITHARSFNVIAPDGTKYCGQLQDCPIEDQMLAQKLLLQTDPEKFFKSSNVSRPTAVHERERRPLERGNEPFRW